MSSGKSSSSSSSQTQSVNEDNRVVADGSGTVALGKDAIYSVQVANELSPNMLSALKEFISLVRDAGEVVVTSSDQSNKQAQATVAAVTAAIAADKAGTTGAWTNMVPLLIGAVVLVIIFGMLTGRKRE